MRSAMRSTISRTWLERSTAAPALDLGFEGAAHPVNALRIEADKGFIKQQQSGFSQECCGDGQLAGHAAGVFADEAPLGLGEGAQLKEMGNAGLCRALVNAADGGDEAQKLFAGEIGVEFGALSNITQVLTGLDGVAF